MLSHRKRTNDDDYDDDNDNNNKLKKLKKENQKNIKQNCIVLKNKGKIR